MASYFGDIRSDLWNIAVTQANVTATVTGPAIDMVTGDGRCGLLLANQGDSNFTYFVANILQSTQSTGGFTAISGATIACTTGGVTTLTFLRDSQYLKVKYDFAGSTITGQLGFVGEQLKLSNG